MSSSGNHPEITSLIRFKDQARDDLTQGKFIQGLEKLIYLLRELKTEDQDEELKENLIKERKVLTGFKYPGGIRKRVQEMRFRYEEWYDETIQILWDNGYLSNEKYKFEIKEDEKKFE